MVIIYLELKDGINPTLCLKLKTKNNNNNKNTNKAKNRA